MKPSFDVVAIDVVNAIIEFVVAYVAYKTAKKDENLLGWLKLFAAGVAIHAVSLLFAALAFSGVKGLTLVGKAVNPPIRGFALALIFYSLLRGVGIENKKLFAAIAIIALYFIIGVPIARLGKVPEGPLHVLLFDIPHFLLTILIPLLIAAIMFNVYKESGDKAAIFFAIAMIVYALGTLIALAMMHISFPLWEVQSIKVGLWTLAFILIMVAFVVG